jgi:hypothetical protein
MKKPQLAKFDLKELEVKCCGCLGTETVIVRPEDYEAWKNGKYAQDAFPYLTSSQRELLISSTCGPCFDRMFPEDDE